MARFEPAHKVMIVAEGICPWCGEADPYIECPEPDGRMKLDIQGWGAGEELRKEPPR